MIGIANQNWPHLRKRKKRKTNERKIMLIVPTQIGAQKARPLFFSCWFGTFSNAEFGGHHLTVKILPNLRRLVKYFGWAQRKNGIFFCRTKYIPYYHIIIQPSARMEPNGWPLSILIILCHCCLLDVLTNQLPVIPTNLVGQFQLPNQ